MPSFCLRGAILSDDPEESSNYVHIQLPKAKHFKAEVISHSEDKVKYLESMTEAVNISRIFRGTQTLGPYLSHLQTAHSYPLAQGPINLPIETFIVGGGPNIQEVLTARTAFVHERSQKCYTWTPMNTGTSAWGAVAPDPDFSKIQEMRLLMEHWKCNLTRASRTTGAKGNNFLQVVTSFNYRNHQVASRK